MVDTGVTPVLLTHANSYRVPRVYLEPETGTQITLAGQVPSRVPLTPGNPGVHAGVRLVDLPGFAKSCQKSSTALRHPSSAALTVNVRLTWPASFWCAAPAPSQVMRKSSVFQPRRS